MEIDRKLSGNEYLPPTTIRAIDHSKEMNAIRQEYGSRYFSEKGAVQSAADLWGFKCNEFGVIADKAAPIEIRASDRYTVKMDLSESSKGHYLIGVDTHTPISGFSYAPSVFVSLGYPS